MFDDMACSLLLFVGWRLMLVGRGALLFVVCVRSVSFVAPLAVWCYLFSVSVLYVGCCLLVVCCVSCCPLLVAACCELCAVCCARVMRCVLAGACCSLCGVCCVLRFVPYLSTVVSCYSMFVMCSYGVWMLRVCWLLIAVCLLRVVAVVCCSLSIHCCLVFVV